MGQAHYTCESRQDLIMPGLVWSSYKVWQVCFCTKQGRQTGVHSIHSHSRTEQGKMIGFLASAASVIATTGYEGSPQNGSLFRNNGRKKAKAKGPAIDKSRWSAEGFWKIRQTVLAHLVGGIVGYGLLRSVQATERKPTTPLASWAPATKSVGAPRSG